MSESESDESNLEYGISDGAVGCSCCLLSPVPWEGESGDMADVVLLAVIAASLPMTFSGELVTTAGLLLALPGSTAHEGRLPTAGDPPLPPPPPDPVLLWVLSRRDEDGGR